VADSSPQKCDRTSLVAVAVAVLRSAQASGSLPAAGRAIDEPPSAWMAYFLPQLINGLTLGSIYGLIAI
jgi:hypothetical protein